MFYIKLTFVVLAIFAARLYFIHTFGGPVPFWDDWILADKLLLPWMNGAFDWRELFSFHNMHLPVFTKIVALLSFIFNDNQWDVILGMSISALFVAFNCILLGILLKKWMLPSVNENLLLFLVLLLWIIPNSWSYRGNILWNFGSAWYFLNFFSLMTIWGLFHTPFSIKWWIGLCSGFCAFLNIAGGFTILLAIALFQFYLIIVDTHKRLSYLPTLLASLSIIMLCGYLTRLGLANDIVYTSTRELTVGYVLQGIANGLAFPWVKMPWLSLLLYLPFILVLFRTIKNHCVPSTSETFVLVLGGWVILSAILLGYGRGDAAEERYLDYYPFGIVANFLAFYVLIQYCHVKKANSLVIGYAVLVWLPIVLAGLAQITMTNLFTSPSVVRITDNMQLTNTRAFIKSAILGEKPTIPIWTTENAELLLANPTVQALLPHQLAMPKLLKSTADSSGFVANGFHPILNTYQAETVLGSYPNELLYDFFSHAQQAVISDTPHSTRVQYANLLILENTLLTFQIGVRNTSNGVKFSVFIDEQPIFMKQYQSATKVETFTIALKDYVNKQVAISFVVDLLGGDKTTNSAYWSAPKLFKRLDSSMTLKRFVSETIHIRQSFMEIPIAGYLGEKGVSLQLLVEGENTPIDVLPTTLTQENWISTYVRTPARPFKLVAIDNNLDAWFAFAMPRGIGVLSFANLWLLKHGSLLFFIGIGGFLLLIVATSVLYHYKLHNY